MSISIRHRIVAAAVLVTAATAQAQVKNGQFEKGGSGIAPPHWTEVGGVLQNPPEGAGLGGPGNNSAVVTAGPGVIVAPGMRGAALGQTFPCGPQNAPGVCFVRFAYRYDEQPPQSNAAAFVAIRGQFGTLIAELPDNTPPGPGYVQIAYPSCGPMKLSFGAVEPILAPMFLSSLLIDHVMAKCDNQPFPNTPMLELHPLQGQQGAVPNLVKILCDKLGPWQDLGHGKPGIAGKLPILDGVGPLSAGANNGLALADGRPNAPVVAIAGLADISVPFLAGTLVPRPDFVIFGLTTDAAGSLALPIQADNALAALVGTDLYFQMFVMDPAALANYAFSNGLKGTVAP